VYEGVAFEHCGHLDHLLRGRKRPRAARFAGGAARSQPWLDIFASAMDFPLELSDANELGALGAAIIAAVGVGIYPNLNAASAAMTRVARRVEPNPELSRILARRRRIFGALREQLSPAWSLLG
jgi:L-xylulokinase